MRIFREMLKAAELSTESWECEYLLPVASTLDQALVEAS